MKIAFVSQPMDVVLPPYQNSIGACTYGLARALAKSCEVVVYGLKDKHAGVPSEVTEGGVRYKFIPATRTDDLAFKIRQKYRRAFQSWSPVSSADWFYPEFGRQVAADVRKEQCHVIHIQHSSQYAPVLKTLNPSSKVVLHLHAEWFSQMHFPRLAERLRHVDMVTAVSDYIVKKTNRDFTETIGKSEALRNGIDPEEFSRKPIFSRAPDREKRILYSGAISPHKGIHVLLEAFYKVLHYCPDVRLDIVGSLSNYPVEETFDAKDEASLRKFGGYYAKNRAARLKVKLGRASRDAGTYQEYLKTLLCGAAAERVHFLGFIPRPELIDLYYQADVFAFPPVWNEGFGLPPLEAMAAGVPVVASRSGGVVETVQDGRTGFLVEKEDSDSLADALVMLLKDDAGRETMGRAARRRAFESFTWDVIAREALERYRGLCEPAPQSPAQSIASVIAKTRN
ncbi:MAG TPA: glycosyltransferase family 4 protein [Bryobacteraceae bacterium]|nr:glycosyltransferase family 4 protein [Bryobacteraceae bacterium]